MADIWAPPHRLGSAHRHGHPRSPGPHGLAPALRRAPRACGNASTDPPWLSAEVLHDEFFRVAACRSRSLQDLLNTSCHLPDGAGRSEFALGSGIRMRFRQDTRVCQDRGSTVHSLFHAIGCGVLGGRCAFSSPERDRDYGDCANSDDGGGPWWRIIPRRRDAISREIESRSWRRCLVWRRCSGQRRR